MVPKTVCKSDPKSGILKPKSNSPNDQSAIVKFCANELDDSLMERNTFWESQNHSYYIYYDILKLLLEAADSLKTVMKEKGWTINH